MFSSPQSVTFPNWKKDKNDAKIMTFAFMESTVIKQHVLIINGGSSSIKFAMFEVGDVPRRFLAGNLERIGTPEAILKVSGLDQADNFSRPFAAPDLPSAVTSLIDWIEQCTYGNPIVAVGHRVVHGGPKYHTPQLINSEMAEELRRLSSFDPEHLPEEILLIEAFQSRFPEVPQVACFDTAFHHDLPCGAAASDPAPI